MAMIREHSSVGLEHLPYKQRVIGSTPIAPTRIKRLTENSVNRFYFAAQSAAKSLWLSALRAREARASGADSQQNAARQIVFYKQDFGVMIIRPKARDRRERASSRAAR